MKKKLFFILGLTFIGLNVFFAVTDANNNKSLDPLSIFQVKHAMAEDEGGSGCNYCRVVTTQSGWRVVTIFDFSVARDAGITLNKFLPSLQLAQNILASFHAEPWDQYMTSCILDGGQACCLVNDWAYCASGGCPEVGYFTTN